MSVAAFSDTGGQTVNSVVLIYLFRVLDCGC